MYYVKVTRDFIIELRYTWANFIKELISEVNRVVDRNLEDIEEEADDDLRNERYNEDSIYDWKNKEIAETYEWKKEWIDYAHSIESNGNSLINTLSDMKFYETKKNTRFIFDFCEFDYYEKYDGDLKGAINVSIVDTYVESYLEVYEFRANFNSPKVKYTEWMLDD